MLFTTISPYMTWIVFLYGILFGSFANVIAYRVPRHESIVWPRSHCPSCEHPLSFLELIPIISWLMLRGSCRHCKSSISVRYPAIELSVGVLWVLTLWHVNSFPQLIVWCLFWLFLLAVVGSDLTSMRVPNVLSLPAVVLFFASSTITHIQSWQGALLGMVTGFVTLYTIHLLSRGKMGLGDVKLYLSIGMMLGPWVTFESFILASFCGGIVGIGLLLTKVVKRGQPIPFVPYIAMGVVLSAFYGKEILQWYIALIVR